MRERPILMSAPMVRAILEGRKTQTRRVAEITSRCPHGVPGDRLWVRETWRTCKPYDPYSPAQIDSAAAVLWLADDAKKLNGPEEWGKKRPGMFMPRWASRITLDLIGVRVERVQEISETDAKFEGLRAQEGTGLGPGPGYKWHGIGYHGAGFTDRGEPTFHTPVDDGRCSCKVAGPTPAQCAYRELWDSLNAKRGFGWDKNPWVWVVEFKRA